MRRTIVAVVCVAAVSGLSACGEANGSGKSASPKDKAMTVGVSNLGVSFPFPAAIGEGIKAKAKELGVHIVQLDAKGDAQKQGNDVQDLIGQAPDGVLLLPVDSGVAVGYVDQLKAAKIPVVAVASQVGDHKKRKLEDVYSGLAALVTQQEFEAGKAAGRLALKALPSGGKVAVVEGAAGFAEVETRFARFLDPAKDAGVKFQVVARQPGDWTAAAAQSACQNMLSSNPDINLFYAESDDMGVGCAKAAKAAKSHAKVIGIGGSKLGIAAVKSGELAGTVCYKPYDLGELAMQTLYDHVKGTDTKSAEFVSYKTPAIDANNVAKCAPQW